MSEVVHFPNKSVSYVVEITHRADGAIEAFVEGVSNSERSVESVWWAISQLASKHMNAEQIHAAMLARIDKLMDAEAGDDLKELDALADACQAYEAKIFP